MICLPWEVACTGSFLADFLHARAGLDNGSEKLFDSANQTAYESVQALSTVQSYNLQDRVVAI